jgi:RAP domain
MLNQALAKAVSALAVLQLLQQHATLQHVAAGQSLDAVGFSTALHRLGRHVAFGTKQARAQALSHPHTALLVTSIAEAILTEPQTFQPRHLSNMAWALAKLELPPPLSVLPMSCHSEGDVPNIVASGNRLRDAAETVRQTVMDVARERAKVQTDGSTSTSTTRWIPALSQLSGYLLDFIGELVMKRTVGATAESGHSKLPQLRFETQGWSNLLWAWSTAGRAKDDIFGLVIKSMIQRESEILSRDHDDIVMGNDGRPSVIPQHWSNAVWAMATARCYNGHEDLLAFVARMMEDKPDIFRRSESQALTNMVWGVATLLSNKPQQQPGTMEDATLSDLEQQSALTILRFCLQEVVQRNAVGFCEQGLSNVAWSAATLSFGLSTAAFSTTTSADQEKSIHNYVALSSLQPSADTTLMVQAINVIISASIQQLPRFTSQGLGNLVWALARLLSVDGKPNAMTKITRENADPLLKGIGLQLANPQRDIVPQNVGNALWALAKLNYCNESIYCAIAKRIIPSESHLYEPQHLSNTVWAFATAGVSLENVDVFETSLVPGLQHPTPPNDPVTISFAVAVQELMRRPQHFTNQNLKDVVWSFSKLGIRHPALFKFAAEHLVGGTNSTTHSRLEEFSAQELSNVAWAYAKQDQLAQNASERLKRRGKFLVYRTIYMDVGEQLLHRLFISIAEAIVGVHDDLRKASPQEISNTAWAFATLGYKETRYLEAANDALAERIDRYLAGETNPMTCFNGQELSNLLWAMATLNFSPGNSLQSLMPYLHVYCTDSNGKVTAQSISKQFTRQNLANMAWACAVFGKNPDDLMHFLYTGLLGPPGENDPAAMQAMYEDSGLQWQEIMTLVYAHADMKLRGRCQNLTLPESFPDAWLPSTMDRDCLELDLSTSKTQRDVAAAFNRVGFEHFEEFTITMADMAQTYGLRLPFSPMEVISIDVANVDEKIAIEVDGPPHYVCRICNDVSKTGSEEFGYSKTVNGKLVYQFRWTGEQQEINGSTVLKERLLTLLGWRVVRIPFWEWEALGKDAQAKDEYCANLLRNLNQDASKDGPP